jgi:hypothetical protein
MENPSGPTEIVKVGGRLAFSGYRSRILGGGPAADGIGGNGRLGCECTKVAAARRRQKPAKPDEM